MTFRLTEPKLRGRALFQHLRDQQRKWIEYCESNGVSYAGERGPVIRLADEAELARLEARLNEYPPPATQNP